MDQQQQAYQQTQQNYQQNKQLLDQTINLLAPIALPSDANLKIDLRECKICLQTGVFPQNQMVTPCKCIGTVRYVHDLCFRKWVQRQIKIASKTQQLKLQKEGIQCQLCKTKIGLTFSNKYNCYSCSKFKEIYSQNRPLFYIFVFFFILNFGSIAYLIYNSSNNPINQQNQIIVILIALGFTFLIFTALLVCYYFLKKYVVEKEYSLQGYSHYQQRKRRKINQIAPEELG